MFILKFVEFLIYLTKIWLLLIFQMKSDNNLFSQSMSSSPTMPYSKNSIPNIPVDGNPNPRRTDRGRNSIQLSREMGHVIQNQNHRPTNNTNIFNEMTRNSNRNLLVNENLPQHTNDPVYLQRLVGQPESAFPLPPVNAYPQPHPNQIYPQPNQMVYNPNPGNHPANNIFQNRGKEFIQPSPETDPYSRQSTNFNNQIYPDSEIQSPLPRVENDYDELPVREEDPGLNRPSSENDLNSNR